MLRQIMLRSSCFHREQGYEWIPTIMNIFHILSGCTIWNITFVQQMQPLSQFLAREWLCIIAISSQSPIRCVALFFIVNRAQSNQTHGWGLFILILGYNSFYFPAFSSIVQHMFGITFAIAPPNRALVHGFIWLCVCKFELNKTSWWVMNTYMRCIWSFSPEKKDVHFRFGHIPNTITERRRF